MSTVLRSGLLAISIDVAMAPQGRMEDHRRLAETRSRLQRLMNKHRMAATWAIGEQISTVLSDRFSAAESECEIAILAEASWTHAGVGRSQFNRELGRRLNAAQAAGISVSTLVLSEGALEDHLDLAIRHGITAVRSMPDEHRCSLFTRKPATARSLRFGLWEFPAARAFPGQSSWFGSSASRLARRGIDWAVSTRGVYQLAIDIAAMAERGNSAERGLEKVLRYAARCSQQGLLQVVSLRGAVAQLRGERQNAPARSILRAA